MSLVRFLLYDRSNQPFKIQAEENKSVGEIMDNFFPSSKFYTLLITQKHKSRVVLRSEIIKDVLLESLLFENNIIFKLINLNEFIDVFINFYTRTCLKIEDKTLRLYVTESTTVLEVEKTICNMFDIEPNIYGIFGINEKKEYDNIFKLKSDGYVLFIKRCFENKNFFQLQFNECNEALEKIKPNFEGKFYKISHLEQKILFKKAFKYSLRENTLLRIKKGEIYDAFYNVNKAVITCEKFYGKNIIKLESHEKTWILCTLSLEVCQNMYNAIISCVNFSVIREISTYEKIEENDDIKSKESIIESYKEKSKSSSDIINTETINENNYFLNDKKSSEVSELSVDLNRFLSSSDLNEDLEEINNDKILDEKENGDSIFNENFLHK
ncbi:hypothetical protein GVAV_001438 [Gurleya vavrai]